MPSEPDRGEVMSARRETRTNIAKAKEVFPGATVTAVRRSVDDPLSSIHDTSEPLDDPVPEMA